MIYSADGGLILVQLDNTSKVRPQTEAEVPVAPIKSLPEEAQPT